MRLLDFIALGGFAGISACFYLIRSELGVFSGVCLAGIGMCGIAGWPSGSVDASQWSVTVLGLGLYWFGLLILRTMLRRSVSLNLLSSYADGQMQRDVGSDTRGRLRDAERHGLMRRDASEYRLTRFGNGVAAVVSLLYRATRLS